MTSGDQGQNSWLNLVPYGEKNRTAKVEDTAFLGEQDLNAGGRAKVSWRRAVFFC